MCLHIYVYIHMYTVPLLIEARAAVVGQCRIQVVVAGVVVTKAPVWTGLGS